MPVRFTSRMASARRTCIDTRALGRGDKPGSSELDGAAPSALASTVTRCEMPRPLKILRAGIRSAAPSLEKTMRINSLLWPASIISSGNSVANIRRLDPFANAEAIAEARLIRPCAASSRIAEERTSSNLGGSAANDVATISASHGTSSKQPACKSTPKIGAEEEISRRMSYDTLMPRRSSSCTSP